jgi:hypothetical protein
MNTIRRVAATGCVAGVALAVVGVGTAAAQGDPSAAPAPITIGPAQVRQLCEQRVPKLQTEVTKLINRIDAGPTDIGSTRWLQAQAQRAEANGRQARADILDARVERRDGVLTILRKVRTKLTDFTWAHCGGPE